MRPTGRDITGFVLVAATLGLLAIRGSERHERGVPPRPPASLVVPLDMAAAPTADGRGSTRIAFVGVNLLEGGSGDVIRNQVVIVEDGLVTGVGPVGRVRVPAGARRVRATSSDFLLPATATASGSSMRIHASRSIVPGARVDLVLLPSAPASGRELASRPGGVVLDGRWIPVGHPWARPTAVSGGG